MILPRILTRPSRSGAHGCASDFRTTTIFLLKPDLLFFILLLSIPVAWVSPSRCSCSAFNRTQFDGELQRSHSGVCLRVSTTAGPPAFSFHHPLLTLAERFHPFPIKLYKTPFRPSSKRCGTWPKTCTREVYDAYSDHRSKFLRPTRVF